MAMYDIPNWHWRFIHLHCTLIASLVASSSLSSGRASVSSTVGSQAVLPCSWKSHVDDTSLPACTIRWQTLNDIVFEQRGAQRWQAAEFQGRLTVPEERLGAGDCSLMLSDVQFTDEGLYESFMVVNGARISKRIFIQSVRLFVYDHKSKQTHAPGEDMVMELYTPKATRVVFLSSNSTEWSDLWMRGDNDTHRLEKNQHREELTLKGLKREDKGEYMVLDEHGLAVSTIQLSMEGIALFHEESKRQRLFLYSAKAIFISEVSNREKVPQIQDKQVPIGDATTNTCCSLLIVLSLSYSSLILHLL